MDPSSSFDTPGTSGGGSIAEIYATRGKTASLLANLLNKKIKDNYKRVERRERGMSTFHHFNVAKNASMN